MNTIKMKPIKMTEDNAVVHNGEAYFWLPDESAWIEQGDISMSGDFMGLVAPSRPRYKLYGNGGIKQINNSIDK